MAEGTEERSQNETVYAAALDRVCTTFGVQTLHEEQRKAVDTFFEGEDIVDSSNRLDSFKETLHHFHRLTTEGTDGRPGPVSEQSGTESHRANLTLIPQEARLLVVTATATKSTRQKIFETLQLGPKTIVIEKSPDRPNLKYSAIYIRKSQPFKPIFGEV